MELSEKDSWQLQSDTAVVEYVGSKDHRLEKKGSRKKKYTSAKPGKEKSDSNKANVGKNNVSQSGTFTNTNVSCFL